MIFYVVASPIGNLEDISFRAVRILGEVDYILAEDTRVSKKLLDHYNIKKPVISFHHHSGLAKYDKILGLLRDGKSLALLSDAGTPNISDPGSKLVDTIREKLPQVIIEAIPGPSAITAALSISGILANKFVFMGFLPHKKGRSKNIKSILEYKYPVVFYESKHRILKLLIELQAINFSKKIMIFREMTKMHYSFYNQKIEDLIDIFKQDNINQKGEFTIIIYE